MKDYSEPKLYPLDHNIKEDWYVMFRIKDPNTGKRRKKTIKLGLNYIKSKAERLEKGNALKEAVRQQLKEGWNPFIYIEPKPKFNLVEAIEEIAKIKYSNLRPKSKRTYGDIVNMFIEWLKKSGYSKMLPEAFKNTMAQSYMDYLLIDRKYSGKSHNTQLGILKTIFYMLVEREIINKNPFKGIREQKENKEKIFAFTYEERIKLKDLIKNNDIRLYYFVQFIYYCAIRRTELLKLKISHIDFNNKTIIIYPDVSKTGKQDSISIPVSFEPILYEMGLDKLPKDFYVFGKKLESCLEPQSRADYVTERHRKYLKELNINHKSIYGWKHSGAAELLLLTKNIFIVQKHLRHADPKQTETYLRSLGLQVNNIVRNVDFKF